MPGERLDELNLPPMYVNNEDPKQTAYTVSADYKYGTTTGISAADRAATFRALANPLSKPSDFSRPGHVFPLRPRPVRDSSARNTRTASLQSGRQLTSEPLPPRLLAAHKRAAPKPSNQQSRALHSRFPSLLQGGVRERDGHTEAAMDLTKLAGLNPCGVLAEVVNDDGSMARVPELEAFCKKHGLVLTSIADLINYLQELDANA